jgi:hypothetical protein
MKTKEFTFAMANVTAMSWMSHSYKNGDMAHKFHDHFQTRHALLLPGSDLGKLEMNKKSLLLLWQMLGYVTGVTFLQK